MVLNESLESLGDHSDFGACHDNSKFIFSSQFCVNPIPPWGGGGGWGGSARADFNFRELP